MGIASKYNKSGIDWNINTEGFEFHKLSEIEEGTEIIVKGLYINRRGKYDPSPVLIASDRFFNLPSYMTETVEEMLKDDELVNAIKTGKVGAIVRKFIDGKFGKESYTVDWSDI